MLGSLLRQMHIDIIETKTIEVIERPFTMIAYSNRNRILFSNNIIIVFTREKVI
jgi:flavorubredoxin